MGYGLLTAGLLSGLLRPPPDQMAGFVLPPRELSYGVVVNVLVIVVVMVLSGYLAHRLRTAGGRIEVAEARAESAERLAALGRLSAGLAHEIRNPLGSIAGSIRLLRTSPALSEEDRKLCEIIQREAARLGDLVDDIVNVARQRLPEITLVDVARTAREVVELASRSGRGVSDVEITYTGEDTVVVRADGAQLRQLMWNLVRNGVQAARAGGAVRVIVEPDPAGRVVLVVEDDGPGIDPAARDRIFDAFFTTRSHGTGIGLAVGKRIADDHGFAIQVEGGHGAGARFRVVLGLPQPSGAELSGAKPAPVPSKAPAPS
jgi:signal transduction histidine kinase